MLYFYKGVIKSQLKRCWGFSFSSSLYALFDSLNADGITPIIIKRPPAWMQFIYSVYLFFIFRPPFYTKKKVKNFNFIILSLLKSGLSINNALKVVIKIVDFRTKMIANTILFVLENGGTLEEAFKPFSFIFTKKFVKKFSLPGSGNKLISIFDTENKEIDQFYKIVLLPLFPLIFSFIFVAIASVIISNIYFIPMQKLSAMLELDVNKNSALLTSITLFIQTHAVFIFFFILGSFLGLKSLFSFYYFRRVFDFLVLKLPFFGEYIRISERIAFYRMMKKVGASGQHIYNGVSYCCEIITNSILRDQLKNMARRLELGESIGASMQGVAMFSGVHEQILKIATASSDFLSGVDKLLELSLADMSIKLVIFSQALKFLFFSLLIGLVLFVAGSGAMLYLNLLYFTLH